MTDDRQLMEEYLDDLDASLGCAELWEAMYDRRNPEPSFELDGWMQSLAESVTR